MFEGASVNSSGAAVLFSNGTLAGTPSYEGGEVSVVDTAQSPDDSWGVVKLYRTPNSGLNATIRLAVLQDYLPHPGF